MGIGVAIKRLCSLKIVKNFSYSLVIVCLPEIILVIVITITKIISGKHTITKL